MWFVTWKRLPPLPEGAGNIATVPGTGQGFVS